MCKQKTQSRLKGSWLDGYKEDKPVKDAKTLKILITENRIKNVNARRLK